MTKKLLISLVLAVINFVVGMLWYSPLVFGTIWMSQLPDRMMQMSMNQMLINYGFTFALVFSSSYGLVYLIERMHEDEKKVFNGVKIGFIIAFLIITPGMLMELVYSLKAPTIVLIDIAYQLVTYSLMGGAYVLVKNKFLK